MAEATLQWEAETGLALPVRGHVPAPRVYRREDLLQLERRELGPLQVNCFTGRPIASFDSYAGVRLIDVLDGAGFTRQPRSELKRCVVMAEGLDGYRALFTWSELYNNEAGDGVLVLHERNGQPLDAHLGPLSLIAAADRHLGPRHLRNLQGVQVRLL